MRVLLAILEAGGGHRSAARSVAAALAALAPAAEITIEDVGEGSRVPFVNDAPAAYRLFLDSPVRPAFEVAWRYFDRRPTSRALLHGIYPFARGHLDAIVRRLQPDLVVGLHAGLAQAFAWLRRDRGYRYRVATVVTDIVTIHALWAAPESDLCLVPTEEALVSVVRRGVAPAITEVTGFPIHPDFVRHAPAGPPPATPPERPRVLLMGGGSGAGGVDALLQGLERLERPLAIEVVTGRNPALYERLKDRPYRHEVRVHGFVHAMAPLMATCDVVVTKAGPGSLMEAWAMRKPALVGQAVGPQEVGNLEWGARRGLAWPAGGPERVHEHLDRLLATWPEVVAGMQPIPTDGAHRIAERLLGLARGEPIPRPAPPARDPLPMATGR